MALPASMPLPSSPERITYSVIPELGGTELLTVENNRHLWRVFHEKYTVCVVPEHCNSASSISEWSYRGRQYAYTRGCTSLMEPGELHVSKRMTGPWANFWVLEIPSTLMSEFGSELGVGPNPHFRLAQLQSPALAGTLQRLFEALRRHESALGIQSHFIESLHSLIEYAGERKPSAAAARHRPALCRAREFLHEHYAENVTLADLARVSGLTRHHLVRSFHRAFGLPPHAYQIQLRVAAARRAIAAGTRIVDIDVGFYDQSQLCRYFKRIIGVTPREYATAIRGQRVPA